MPSYRAVLFDFFGTLTQAVSRGPWHATVARDLGCDPAEFVAVLDRSFHDRAQGRLGSLEDTLRWSCDQLGVHPPAKRMQAALQARVAAVRADTHLRPDAVAALTAARARGLRTALVSDCSHELPAFLPQLPIAPLLDTCVYSVDVGHCKPHPSIYLTACERLGVDPADCLYLGDGDGEELTGAAAVGMTALRLAAPDLRQHLVFRADSTFAGPTVSSLLEAIAWLGRSPALA